MYEFAKARRLTAGRPTDSFSTAMGRAMRAAVDQVRAFLSTQEIATALASRNAMPLVTDARWRTVEAKLLEQLEVALGRKITEAGQAELTRLERAPRLAKAATLRGRFNLRNPFSEDFVRRRGAELVTAITERARQQIRDAVEAGFTEGRTVDQTARTIRSTIGLDPRLSRAVETHMTSLIEAGSPDEVIERSSLRYANQLLNYRAELIARTETIAASNQGVMDSWRQAQQEGLIQPGMKKRWIHAKGSLRTCPICDELGSSDPIPLDEEFSSALSGESYARPPAHPACRCTMGLVRP